MEKQQVPPSNINTQLYSCLQEIDYSVKMGIDAFGLESLHVVPFQLSDLVLQSSGEWLQHFGDSQNFCTFARLLHRGTINITHLEVVQEPSCVCSLICPGSV